MSGRVVVVGSVNVDDTLPVHSFPVPGETVLLAGPRRRGLGGKGANQAVAAARAGASVVFAGAVGTDAAGEWVRDRLADHGVDVAAIVSIPGLPTGQATILIDRTGENIILVDPGANGGLSSERVSLEQLIEAGDVVVLQGEVPGATIEAAARACRARGARFLLNLAPPLDLSPETIALADPLVVNDIEAAHLGITLAADAVIAGIVSRSVIVTLGGDGMTGVGDGGAFRLTAHPVRVVDTTGAGDAFVGTLAARLAGGAGIEDAARDATAAAAFAVTRPGASDSYGTPDEIATLFG